MKSNKLVLFALTIIAGLMVVNMSNLYNPVYAQERLLPHWIKNNAKLWYENEISDSEFANSISWLVEKKIIPIQLIAIHNSTYHRLDDFKNVAYHWSTGKVSDKNFVGTIRYMINHDVIKMSDNFELDIKQQLKTVSVENETERTAVIVPVLTSSAYSERGFYAHYRGECDDCLTVKIRDDLNSFVGSSNGLRILKSLGYDTITDIDIDQNPKILDKYDEIILLHNEYVTQREFDAITKHPQVIYLYPNALYAKVSIDYWNNTVTLLQGHGYPDKNIVNGFDWKFDNSRSEYDTECNNWNFHKVDNGIMLNCYPEDRLNYDIELLQAIKEF